MKTKRKSLIVTIMVLALAVLLLVALTLAYLTDQRQTTNVLGIGADEDGLKSVMISLTEPTFEQQVKDAAGAEYAALPQAAAASSNSYQYTQTTSNDIVF